MAERSRIILHGKQADNGVLREAVECVRNEGVVIDVALTWEAGDAARLAREAVHLGIGNIIAAGGDGSLNEVLQGMFDASAELDRELPTMGVLPLGTANDFARSANLPQDDLAAALRLATRGSIHAVDVARHNGRVFLNVATGGFGTEITTETPENLKKALGAAAYFITGLTKLGAVASKEALVRVGNFRYEGPFVMIAIGNARTAGGGQALCPDALINDGALDIAILPQQSEDEMPSVFRELAAHGFGDFSERVIAARGSEIFIESDEPLTLNFDGEPVTENAFHLQVSEGALGLRLPDDCPLIG